MLLSQYSDYLQLTLSSKLFEFAYKRIFSSVELGEHGYQYNKHALVKLPVILPHTGIELNVDNLDGIIYNLYSISKDEVEFIETKRNS